MKYIFLTFVMTSILSCRNEQVGKIERTGEPDIISLPYDDSGMIAAIDSAKLTLSQFDRALKDSSADNTSFALKLKFETGNTLEHIWFTRILAVDSGYTGLLNNLPSKIRGLKIGERRRLDRADISDWMYGHAGELRGGFTIREVRSRMSAAERESFDAGFSLKIRDPG